MVAWLYRLRRKFRRYWWWPLVLLILHLVGDRLAGNVNKWIDDQSGDFLIGLRDFLNWSAQDSLGIAGILLVGTFLLFMGLAYFQKDEPVSTEPTAIQQSSGNLFTLDRVIIAVVMVAIGGLIGYVLSRNNNQGGLLQMDSMIPYGPPLLTVGTRNSIRVTYRNRGTAPITGAKEVTMLSFNPHVGKIQDPDTVVFNESKQMARIKKLEASDREGATIGLNHPLVSIVDIDFTEADVKALMEGTATLYLIGHAYWNERPGEFDLCFKLVPPKYYPLKPLDVLWIHCDTKKANSKP